ncbi:hypothetical protein C1H69_23090 [Billgrantia endophytica]|uniref:Uncharacterized protein n=1 Tax=Billgrantia endophytica TaxID=2033802 RepID=A0A2N7TUF0_9GAMM|nr:hypothetical protein C1H69_23090 [Halomonas endophytica]
MVLVPLETPVLNITKVYAITASCSIPIDTPLFKTAKGAGKIGSHIRFYWIDFHAVYLNNTAWHPSEVT